MKTNEYELELLNRSMNMDNELNILKNQANFIKIKDINSLNFLNKKEDEIKNLIISFEFLLLEKFKKPTDDIYKILQKLLKVKIYDNEIKFTYDLNDSFINLNKEEIEQKENKNLNKKLQVKDLEDRILEKISITLPQDLIFLKKCSNLNKKNKNIIDKIIEYYQNGRHINICNFIKKMNTQRNIIYTYSLIDEFILQNISNNLKTKMFDRINKFNIKEFKITSSISNNELKLEFEKFALNSKEKILILKLNGDEIDTSDFFEFFNEYYKNIQNLNKAFIFIVHVNKLKEINKTKLKKDKKYIKKNEMINIYTNYYQIFVDELNEKEKSISEIIIKEEINIKELILSIFTEKIKLFNDEKIIEKLLNIILKNPELIIKSYQLISVIIKCIINTSPKLIIENLDIIKNKNKLYLELINKSNNEALNQIILNVFENQFNSYFESIPQLSEDELQLYFPKYIQYKKTYNKINSNLIVLDRSLELFRSSIDYLNDIYLNNNIYTNKNELISILYCISYIKMYLYKCIYFNFYNIKDFNDDFDEIIKIINDEPKNNFKKMIKIYILKLFFYLLNNNYQNFSEYQFLEHKITFFQEIKEKFVMEKETNINYFLIPGEDLFNIYKETFGIFEFSRLSDFNNSEKYFKDNIEKYGIDIFFIISSNLIFSNLSLNNHNNNEYLKYSSLVQRIFNSDIKIPDMVKRLFSLFSNENEFTNIIKSKLINQENSNKIDSNTIEILLYSLRFCLQTKFCEDSNNCLYSKIISKDYEKIINENLIPGNNALENIFVESYYFIEKHLNTKPSMFLWISL